MNILNIGKLPKYHLYLLQLENYELGRYFKLLWTKGLLPRKSQRKDLVWTKKAMAIFAAAASVHIFLSSALILAAPAGGILRIVFGAGLFLAFLPAYFIFYAGACLLLWPLDYAAKNFIIFLAKRKVKKFICLKNDLSILDPLEKKGLKIIGIAGSYGKTTMKEVLKTVLNTKYTVLSTPESVNTPVGIARFILKSVSDETEILILEMGEHYPGDIREICKIARPDIAIITGISEAHLERMGSLAAIKKTILEIAEDSNFPLKVVANGDDENLRDLPKLLPKAWVSFYGVFCPELTGFKFETTNFVPEELAWQYDMPAAGLKGKIFLLGEYALGLVVAARQVVSGDADIARVFGTIKPVSHRLEPVKSAGNVLIIDDAYNGNPEGAKEAIKLLSRFTGRRKVYITPGLVETGEAAEEIHKKIGRQLAGVADVVVLIKNSVTPYIELGIKNYEASNIHSEKLSATHYSLPTILWFNSAPEAHAALKDILRPGDVVVFQNDWGDQYQ